MPEVTREVLAWGLALVTLRTPDGSSTATVYYGDTNPYCGDCATYACEHAAAMHGYEAREPQAVRFGTGTLNRATLR